ncbi:MAG TPA: hypothetical protein VFX92_07360 [Candidatus Krumholzibacteria bacterium]|nr:hypothetical protein [Candidatus Krumholzibacteria bacterium]
MITLLRTAAVVALVAAGLGLARAGETPGAAEPDVRLVYESDTRAYYRPCG